MREIRLEEDEYNRNILKFQFLNGDLYFDSSIYGAYALSPGCGAGKTTIIKQLIRLKWNEGILYSAFTRNECNEMYKWIKNNLIGTKSKITRDTLKLEDIIVLHSDYSAEGTNKDLWLNNPEKIADKKIVICTHAKLLDEPLHLIINANFNPSIADAIGPLGASVMGNGATLPRQWILVDESTESKSEKFRITKGMIAAMGVMSNRMNNITTVDKSTGRITYSSSLLPSYRFVREDNFYKEFCKKLNYTANFSPSILLNQLKVNEKTALDKVRNDQFRMTFFNKFNDINFDKSDEVKICFSFTDIIRQGMLTHLLLFDGTSDITLTSSNKFQVLSYPNKYSSEVKLNLFSFYGLDRRIRVDKSIPDIDYYIKDKIDCIVDQLETIIRSNNRTLIFTWMNLKSEETDINDDIDFIQSDYSAEIKDIKLVSESRSALVNTEQYFYRYLQHKLEDRGLIEGINFSVEYYGSGKDKAINDYREYDAVILAGKYQVPNSVINDFNLMFGTNITKSEYYSNRIIQAICRTRIRNHKGESVNVYMSSDWSGDTINFVRRYLKINEFESVIDSEMKVNIDYMYNQLRSKGITPKKAEQIAKLSVLDENIFNAIMNDSNYSTKVRLNELYEIIPVSRKDAHKYSYLMNYLNKTHMVCIDIV